MSVSGEGGRGFGVELQKREWVQFCDLQYITCTMYDVVYKTRCGYAYIEVAEYDNEFPWAYTFSE